MDNYSKKTELFSGTYDGNACNGHLDYAGDPPERGVLTGQWGDISFYRCNDGYCVVDSPIPESGFYYGPCSDTVVVPQTIFGIPVTEARKTVYLKNTDPIVIEGAKLKRVYLKCDRGGFAKMIENAATVEQKYLLYLMNRDKAQPNDNMQICIDICTPEPLELLKINCNESCVLCGGTHHESKWRAKSVVIDAPKAALDMKFSEDVEAIRFFGSVFPYAYTAYGDDYSEGQFAFENLPNLRCIQGDLDINNKWWRWHFEGCKSLNRVYFSKKMMNCPSFSGCVSLEEVFIPDPVDSIPSRAFLNCSALKKVRLSDAIEVIGENAFENCFSLISPWMPKKLRKIEAAAFKGCTHLEKLYLPDTIEAVADDAFEECTRLTIYGKSNSLVETFAITHGIPFVADNR